MQVKSQVTKKKNNDETFKTLYTKAQVQVNLHELTCFSE